jgi:enamine deaminase RidA (YjgF/YER057c/UK114 family)
MIKESVPFGDAMKMKVAFSDVIAIDIADTKKYIWVSGQLAFDERGDIVGRGDMSAQTEQCIKNIEAALAKIGGNLNDIVKVMIFVKDMTDLHKIHEVRLKHFNEPYPTSTLVKITDFVNPDALIEIQAEAVVEI